MRKKHSNLKSKKNKAYFSGSYYKLISNDHKIISIIKYISKNKKGYQLITADNSFQNISENEIDIKEDEIKLSINQENLKIVGIIKFTNIKKPKKDVMGFLRHLPLECKHNIYVPIMSLSGIITINHNETIDFTNGIGYIEGDEGKSFPEDYLWYNALTINSCITVAIAKIPLKLITFRGTFAYLFLPSNKELVFATYNGCKIITIDSNQIVLKKHKYLLQIDFEGSNSQPLLAPENGEMNRIIHEAVDIPSNVKLSYKGNIVFEYKYNSSSLERVNI